MTEAEWNSCADPEPMVRREALLVPAGSVPNGQPARAGRALIEAVGGEDVIPGNRPGTSARKSRTPATPGSAYRSTNSQYNLPVFGKKLAYAGNRAELAVAERFRDPSVKKSVEVDLDLIDHLDQSIGEVELYLTRTAKVDDVHTYERLKTVPGVGPILALVLLYEIHDIHRFETVGQFLSYARLVRPDRESAGKKQGFGNKKIGNAHLRWAFAEAVCLFLRGNEQAKRWQARKAKKHGKGKTLAILAAKLGRAVYHMLRKGQPFDAARFWSC
ncbi:hypothetical protein AYO44_04670 [Planctomycetaceae bacterium SCGC AG-212-F19]|nr:hypothetical protein AYO44_04670 [Planctomycetaceae bacterium SCGC AG-212-F19]